MTVLAVVLALIIGTILMYLLQVSSVAAFQSSINSYHPFLTCLRLLVIGWIAYAWPKLIQYAQLSGRINKNRRTQLMSLRWRTIAWLLIVELVIGQNLISQLLTAMGGTSL